MIQEASEAVLFGMSQAQLNTLGVGMTALSGVAASVWMWVLAQRKKLAEHKADVAEERSAAIISDAQGTVYNLLVQRLTALEKDVTVVREELNKEREHSRQLEAKLSRLENWIRSQNLTPPVL